MPKARLNGVNLNFYRLTRTQIELNSLSGFEGFAPSSLNDIASATGVLSRPLPPVGGEVCVGRWRGIRSGFVRGGSNG